MNPAGLAALMKNEFLVYKATVLPKFLLKMWTINSLNFEENAIQIHLHRSQKQDKEVSKILALFINKKDELSPHQFQGAETNTFQIADDLETLNRLLHDKDIVDGNVIGKIDIRSLMKSVKKGYWKTSTIVLVSRTKRQPLERFVALSEMWFFPRQGGKCRLTII